MSSTQAIENFTNGYATSEDSSFFNTKPNRGFFGTVGNKVIEAMNGTGVQYKIFKTKFG